MTLFLWDLLLFQKYHDCPFLNVSHSFFCRSSETRPPEDDEEEEEEILGSDDDEQEDPKDYVKGKTEKNVSFHSSNYLKKSPFDGFVSFVRLWEVIEN